MPLKRSPVAELSPLACGNETLLLVDDDGGVRGILGQLLETAGYAVLAAGSGQEALDVAAKFTSPIHVLITDMVMPRMPGQELARRMWGLYPELKVIFISGYSPETAGPVEGGPFLQKPFKPVVLALVIRALLDSDEAGVALADN